MAPSPSTKPINQVNPLLDRSCAAFPNSVLKYRRNAEKLKEDVSRIVS